MGSKKIRHFGVTLHWGFVVVTGLFLLAMSGCESPEESPDAHDGALIERSSTGCEGKCSKKCPCGRGETGCDRDRDCESGLYCKIRDGRENICRKNHDDDSNDDDSGNGNDESNNDDDNGNGKKTIYTTASAPDLDLSDRLDFKNLMVKAGYRDLGDTPKCSLSEFQKLVQRKDIKTLYHGSHGSKGKVWLMDGALQCSNTPKFAVENVIFATCLTLKDDCWKNQMGSSSNNILGYTKVSFDGIANKNARAFADNIKSGLSYVKAWYGSNTAINALKDRWCAYVREGGKIVEYSARSGNAPRAMEVELEPVHGDEIVFVDTNLLSDSRDFSDAFSKLSQASYTIAVGSPRTTFFSRHSNFLQKSSLPNPGDASKIAASLNKLMPEDAVLEEIYPIEADGKVVAHRIRFGRVKDGLEVRSGGSEHHKEYLINGGQMVAVSVYWPRITEHRQTKIDGAKYLTIGDTVLELANELVMITRSSVAILSVEACYGSESTGELVPAHCYMDSEGTIWVVNATNGELVE